MFLCLFKSQECDYNPPISLHPGWERLTFNDNGKRWVSLSVTVSAYSSAQRALHIDEVYGHLSVIYQHTHLYPLGSFDKLNIARKYVLLDPESSLTFWSCKSKAYLWWWTTCLHRLCRLGTICLQRPHALTNLVQTFLCSIGLTLASMLDCWSVLVKPFEVPVGLIACTTLLPTSLVVSRWLSPHLPTIRALYVSFLCLFKSLF